MQNLFDSIRQQTNNKFDWIIADGGSVDDTLAIINNNIDIVTLLLKGPDFGIYDAINRAILKVSTPYYLVLGGDDVLEPKAIELYSQAAFDSQADIITANVFTKEFGLLFPGRGRPVKLNHLYYVSQHAVGSLIKTSLHEYIGLYSKYYPIAADKYFLLTAIHKYKCNIYHADFTAGTYSYNGISVSRYYDALLDSFKVDYALSDNHLKIVIKSLITYIRHIPTMCDLN